MASRRYELKERARRQEETRRRIVEATVALHAEVGPARTTVAEIARRAGVGRVTVYNHFPDEASLLGACSASFVAGSPPPDPAGWAAVADPDERLARALGETYAYYRENEAMLANVGRDASLMPALGEIVAAGRGPYEAAVRDVLAAGRREPQARAAIGLALAFSTWRQLTRGEGLDDGEAAALMAAAVRATRVPG